MNRVPIFYSIRHMYKKWFNFLFLLVILLGSIIIFIAFKYSSIMFLVLGVTSIIGISFYLLKSCNNSVYVDNEKFIKKSSFVKPIEINLSDIENVAVSKKRFDSRPSVVLYVDCLVFEFKDNRDSLNVTLDWSTQSESTYKEETLTIVQYIKEYKRIANVEKVQK